MLHWKVLVPFPKDTETSQLSTLEKQWIKMRKATSAAAMENLSTVKRHQK
jgi:hypothetical protein